MEGQEYLNQLAAEARPEEKSTIHKIFTSKFFIVIAIGIVLFIILAVIGSALGGNKKNEKSLDFALKLHLDNTAAVIQTYQPSLKSSDLRSSSASLYSVLSNTSRDLTNYLVEAYDFKDRDISSEIVDQATLEKDGLESDLFEAKINGVLDRIFAHKMVYEISAFIMEEEKIMDMTKNEALDELLATSLSSLKNLYGKFNEFSETK
jgi:hypothetical protein